MQACLPLPKAVADRCEPVGVLLWGVICSLLGLDMKFRGSPLSSYLGERVVKAMA